MTIPRRQLLLLALTPSWAISGCGLHSPDTGHPDTGSGDTGSGDTGRNGTGAPDSGSATSGAVTNTRSGPPPTSGTGGPAGDRVLNVVAHPDDDLLFLSPDLISSIEGGAQVRTIFVTAGDAGRSAAYWQARMRGVQAAYAQLSGSGDDWTPMETGLNGATGLSLADAPQIGLIFLKLPDGGTGSGFHRYRFHSLPRLWRGQLSSVTAVDDSATYSRGGLVDALGRVMRSFAPDVVRTQDFLGRFGDGDHGDHHAVGSLTRAASRAHPGRHRLVAYQDYATQHRAANVPTRLLAVKRACFATYARSDPGVFASRSPGAGYTPGFDAWLRRQYVLAVE